MHGRIGFLNLKVSSVFNYNLINPVNITYRNPKQDPAYKKAGVTQDGATADNGALLPLNSDENKGQRHFPNGNKVQIDYTKNKVNIAQVIEDFKSTIAAINAPEDVAGEVNSYLGLVERESKKEKPSREIILSNLRNASKISDKFIEESLKKPSTVVEDWVNALFLQQVELKSDPSFVNEAFRVQIPENKRQDGTVGVSASVLDNAGIFSDALYDTDVDIPADANTAGVSLNTISSSSDFQNSPVNIYDMPQNKVTLNEIKPIGTADDRYFVENEQAHNQTYNVSSNLTYSTTAPDLDEPLRGAVFLEEVSGDAALQNTLMHDETVQSTKKDVNTVIQSDEIYRVSAARVSGDNSIDLQASQSINRVIEQGHTRNLNAETSILPELTPEERAARRNFVRAKRIVKENGDPYNALKLYDEALKLVQNSADENLKAAIHFERGRVFDDYDYAEFALKDYNSATKCSDNNLKTHAHLRMGRIYDDYVMFDPAVQQYTLAVETSEEAQNSSGKTRALRYLAALFADRYDKENTEIFNNLSIDAARETGNLKTLSKTLMDAAENFEYVGEDTKALKTYKEAAKVLYAAHDFDALSKNYEAASEIMERLGNGAKAMSLLSKALQYRQKAELQAA